MCWVFDAAFSSCSEQGPLSSRVRASHCGGSLCCRVQAPDARALLVAAHGLSSCGAQAPGRWNLPRLWIEPTSPALAGRFPSTPPRGKSKISLFFKAWEVFRYMRTTLICWWTHRLLPCLAIVNNAAMNTGGHVSFWISAFFFFFPGYIPRSGISGSDSRRTGFQIQSDYLTIIYITATFRYEISVEFQNSLLRQEIILIYSLRSCRWWSDLFQSPDSSLVKLWLLRGFSHSGLKPGLSLRFRASKRI